MGKIRGLLILVLSMFLMVGCSGKSNSSNSKNYETTDAKGNKAVEIGSIEEYEKLLDGTYPLDGYYVLTNDLDLSSLDEGNGVPAIGDATPLSDNVFTGTFDGNNHTITGFKQVIWNDSKGVGLFAVASGAVIRNVNIQDGEVVADPTASSKFYHPVGLLVGEAEKSTTIENVRISGKINSTASTISLQDVGGLAGRMVGGEKNHIDDENAKVKDVFVDVDIVLSDEGKYAQKVGGIVGQAEEITFENVVVQGSIKANAAILVGGFIGLSDACSYINAGAENDIFGDSMSGGFMGEFSNFGRGEMNNVYQTGNVTVNGDRGGLFIGEVKSGVLMTNVYASGELTMMKHSASGYNSFVFDELLIDDASINTYFNGDSVTQMCSTSNVNFSAAPCENKSSQMFIPLTREQMSIKESYAFPFDGDEQKWVMDGSFSTPRLYEVDYDIFNVTNVK